MKIYPGKQITIKEYNSKEFRMERGYWKIERVYRGENPKGQNLCKIKALDFSGREKKLWL